MSDIIEILSSTEFIVIYLIAGIICLIVVIMHSIESSKEKRRLKYNTKNLNNLVEEINEEIEEDDYYDYEKEPVLHTISDVDYGTQLMDVIAPSKEIILNENTKNINALKNIKEKSIIETMVQDSYKNKKEPVKEVKEIKNSSIIQEVKDIENEEFEESETVNIREIKYTSIEPNKEEAKKELEDITRKLKLEQQRKIEQEKPVIERVVKPKIEYNKNNIDLNEFELEQEENSIISLEELNTKGKKMYESNELTQYADEGNEPISIRDLEKKVLRQVKEIKESFNIESVADKPSQEEIDEMLEGTQPIKVEEIKKVHMDDFNTIKSKYTPTPVISPVFGIEKNKKINIENTADYDKLDDEIKKSSEFVMSLKEFQENLD